MARMAEREGLQRYKPRRNAASSDLSPSQSYFFSFPVNLKRTKPPPPGAYRVQNVRSITFLCLFMTEPQIETTTA